MEHLELILSGFSIVIGVLAMLWAVTFVIAIITNAKPAPTAPAKTAVPSAPAPVAAEGASTGGVPAAHLAVIAAAVAASFDTPHRLLSVSGARAHVSAWTQQGLFEHFASHRMPWRSSNSHGRRIKS